MRERQILHVNIADFAVAVEQVVDVCLRQRPIIIANASPRARVFDMSEEAYRAGICKGMRLGQAKRLCRESIVLAPNLALYKRAMVALARKIRPLSPLVAGGDSDGHFFVDMTGTSRLLGPVQDVAHSLRRSIRDDLRLQPIWTIASNLLVAKVASRLVKPWGEYVVANGDEAAFMAPVAMALLPGLSTKEQQVLAEFQLTKAGQVASLTAAQLAVPFGKRASFLRDISLGVDQRQVGKEKRPTKLEFSHVFVPDSNDKKFVSGIIHRLVEFAALALWEREQGCFRVGVILQYSDGVEIARQATSKNTVFSLASLWRLAQLALERAWQRRLRLNSVTLCCDRFSQGLGPTSLFSGDREKELQTKRLMTAFAEVNSRYGGGKLTKAVGLLSKEPVRE